MRQVTDGNWEVRSLEGVDEEKGFDLLHRDRAQPHRAAALIAIKLDGTGLNASDDDGRHSSRRRSIRTATHFIDIWSDVNTPTQMRLYDADGKLVRVIEENKVDALKQYKLGKAELLQVKTRDGFAMEAMMIKPPDFDPSKKYPVMVVHLRWTTRAAGAKRLGRRDVHVASDAGAEGLHHLDLR